MRIFRARFSVWGWVASSRPRQWLRCDECHQCPMCVIGSPTSSRSLPSVEALSQQKYQENLSRWVLQGEEHFICESSTRSSAPRLSSFTESRGWVGHDLLESCDQYRAVPPLLAYGMPWLKEIRLEYYLETAVREGLTPLSLFRSYVFCYAWLIHIFRFKSYHGFH